MYIEDKSAGLTGPSHIGRVRFSKTGATLYYAGRSFQSLKGVGFKANYFDIDTGDEFWISGPRLDGAEGLYGRITQPGDVDADVADAYWRDVRGVKAPTYAKGAPTSGTAEGEGEATASISALSTAGRQHARIARTLRRRMSGAD
jgi:hypothetical protein